jgi:hypothetical protein
LCIVAPGILARRPLWGAGRLLGDIDSEEVEEVKVVLD